MSSEIEHHLAESLCSAQEPLVFGRIPELSRLGGVVVSRDLSAIVGSIPLL